jgi:hypothetical protein
MSTKLYAQGDILLELVDDVLPDKPLPNDPDGAVVLARGEITGHRHAFYDGAATLFRADAHAREVPEALYIGHVKVAAPGAELRHEEHASIALSPGTYRVRRQREWEADGPKLVLD